MEYEVVDSYGNHLGFINLPDGEHWILKRSLLVTIGIRQIVVF